MKGFWQKIRAYVISAIIALAVGGLSALLSADGIKEYNQLIKPMLSPPPWVFSVVWTILFILMGISAAIIWRSDSPEKSDALFLYGTQLVVNFLWTIFFFNFQARLLAFFWLIFLLILVILMTVRFSKISKCAAWLQIPYIIWLVFAAYLNLASYLLNK